ncbi:MAG: hypothetical protein K2G45_12340 [Lachnospiraceae bacterium]|nr:hypothetical protein [Lachnospiraceae bacterium]
MQKKAIGIFMNRLMIALTGILIVMLAFGTAERARADATDTKWTMRVVAGSENKSMTSIRKKDSDSKAYMNWRNSDGTVTKFRVYPNAHRDQESIGIPYISKTDNSTGGYIVSSKGQYHVTNYVKEHQCNYMSLGFKSYIGTGNIWGEWSPDTATAVGTWPILKP